MSGWKRLGVAVSLLWVVAGPLWLVDRTNGRVDQDFQNCLAATHYAASIPSQEKMADDCSGTALAATTSLPQLIADDDSKKVLALLVGVPVLILWLLGSMLIGTTRWIGRGFR